MSGWNRGVGLGRAGRRYDDAGLCGNSDGGDGHRVGSDCEGEFNSDGYLDLAAMNSADHSLQIFTGNGDGTCATKTA